jgi:hypothetical protein
MWRDLFENLQPLTADRELKPGKPGDMAARFRQVRHQALAHRIVDLPRHRAQGCRARAALQPPGNDLSWSQTMAREELKWQNIDADDLPAEVKKSFDAMVEAEATFKADLEKLLKNEGHMPEDKFLVMSRKGKRLGVAFASTPRGEGGAGSLKFKTK